MQFSKQLKLKPWPVVSQNPFDSIIRLWRNEYNILPINLEAQEAALHFIPGWNGLHGFWKQASRGVMCSLRCPGSEVRINITEIIRVNPGFVSGRPRGLNSCCIIKQKAHNTKPTLSNMIHFLGPQFFKTPTLDGHTWRLTLRGIEALRGSVLVPVILPAGQLPVGGLQSICAQRGNDYEGCIWI